MKRFQFVVTVEVPDACTEADVRDYIEEWVSCGRGSLRPPGAYGSDDPGNPLWDLECLSVANLARMQVAR